MNSSIKKAVAWVLIIVGAIMLLGGVVSCSLDTELETRSYRDWIKDKTVVYEVQRGQGSVPALIGFIMVIIGYIWIKVI